MRTAIVTMLLALSAALSVVPAQAYTMYPVDNLEASQAVSAPETPRTEEDSPEWDCTTMGNRVCGGFN